MLVPVEDLRARLAAALAGRYTIEREIGRGGMSIVYLARDLRNERRVALKVLRPNLAQVLGSDRFLREIKVAAGLTHPHILPLFDSDIADGLLFYTMPYVEGESLRHRLQREGRLPVSDAVTIARDVADALAYAHSQNIVHRDIKPENILIEAGHPVVSDFGIARAISAANESRMTGSGIVVGTVDYMSPEQASGGDVDGRSDIYSLACVLYEMLTGHTPEAVTSPSGQVPALSEQRRDITIDVEYAIQVGLARLPGERFATAADFAAALGPPPTASFTRRGRRLPMRWRVAAAVGALAVATMGVILLPHIASAKLDSSLYVVVPFAHRGGAAPKLLNGDQCELLVYDALRQWEDVSLVNDLQVHDFLSRRQSDAEPVNLRAALGVARQFSAGRLIWGEVAQFADTIYVHATLYDVKQGAAVREHVLRLVANDPGVSAKFTELADALLVGGVQSAADPSARGAGTRVFAALQAFEEGQEGRARWDLLSAERAFERALELDPDYVQASFWLAQTRAWEGRPVAEWRNEALAAAAPNAALSARERTWARGLGSLVADHFPDACAAYREGIARDSADFVAWFGLGECQSKDKVIERDATSPSGWRFRSSYHGAVQAYARALQLLPSAHRAFNLSRVTDLIFFTEPNQARSGYVPAADTQWYAAFPGLDHDTLTFVPYPLRDVFAAKQEATPASNAAAVAHNRALLRDITTQWVRVFPNSPEANEALALVLESTGDIADRPQTEYSALGSIRRARRESTEPADRLRLAVINLRLLLKLEDFAGTRALADSTLEQWRDAPDPDAARELAGVAALTGRAHRAAQLLAHAAPDLTVESEGRQIAVRPLPLARAAFALQAYAALGAPADSVTTLGRRVNALIDASVEPQRRESMRYGLLDHPTEWALPLLPPRAPKPGTPGERSRRIVWALNRRDTTTIRATLDTVHAARADLRPGDVAISGTYLEARVLLAIGDTATATELLRRPLEALATLGTGVLANVDQAAALVRAMVLRAELADRAGDAATARRWAATVVELWGDADNPELQATWERMRRLAVGKKP
jgi:tRNA A-37 threonylcarbamoyl transferase component Bud32/tetratricopeptide (TPR) repeat protein